MNSSLKVSYGFFPDPAQALDLGWTADKIMAECKRMPREDLTDDMKQTLIDRGLSLSQVKELYPYSKYKLARVRKSAASTSSHLKFQDGRSERVEQKPTPVECVLKKITITEARQMQPSDLTKKDAELLLNAELTKQAIKRAYGFSNDSSFYIALEKLGLHKRGHIEKVQSKNAVSSVSEKPRNKPMEQNTDNKVEKIMAILYPNGVPVAQLVDATHVLSTIKEVCRKVG